MATKTNNCEDFNTKIFNSLTPKIHFQLLKISHFSNNSSPIGFLFLFNKTRERN
jgi:hypothetical protein